MSYVQIGVTALRTPGGDFLPSVPLYAREEDSAGISEPDKRDLFELGRMVEEYKKEAERLEAEAKAKKQARAEAKREARKKKRRSMYPFI